jgi:small subunit ribosomal protein S4|tara:strand:- start:21720 stop:22334 length:615 start_codon:yes stop_codon:yes gene_type:complete
MSRYRGPKLRITRRLGDLPGLTNKRTERNFPPGQHGPSKANKKSSTSEYGRRLEEKQKVRFNYGLSEKQLFSYVKEARRLKGATGTLLLQLLEMRLENIAYRLGFASTIPAARQLVNHGHLQVNGKKVNIPSFQCRPNDVISVRPKSQSIALVKASLETSVPVLPNNLILEKDKLTGKVTSLISREDVNLDVNELLIVEFYSRK